MHLTRQSIVFVFATIVLCDDIKHSVASPTMATTPNNCLQRQMGIIPTPTTDFVGATKSMRFCNDDAFIHTAPDRGFKSNVMHCFTQAQPTTTPCVGYLSRQTTASTHLLKVSIPCINNDTLCRMLILTATINCLCLHDTCPVRLQSQQHSVLHNIENILNNTLCCITF
jgi:hypothetical protein